MSIKLFAACAALALLFLSCDNNKEKGAGLAKIEQVEIPGNDNKVDGNDQEEKPDPPQTPGQKQKKPDPIKSIAEDWDKKIIKTANLNFELADYAAFNKNISDKVRSLGGYIASEQQIQTNYKIENTVVVKIPVDQFDIALTTLSLGAKNVNERKISSEDVTMQAVDTRSRLEAKKQVRLRYLDFLKEAKNVEEILNVQSQINGIQEDIEAASGRLDYLNHASKLSTINLTYFQILDVAKVDDERPTFATDLARAFKNGWSWIMDLIVGLVSVWPLLFIVILSVILFKRSRTRKPKVIG